MEVEITKAEFERLRGLAHSHFGLDLKPGKESLIQARLSRRLSELGCRQLSAYLDQVAADSTGVELALLADALTTNYTNFLREPEHFKFLCATILPQIAHRREVWIWCAGCATGEEAYSIMFSILEADPRAAVRMLATDISYRALSTARAGIYTAERVAALPDAWLSRYLQKGEGQWQGHFRVKESIRKRIDFRRQNLTQPFGQLPRFPVIFCRNVMIYFSRATQAQLIHRFSQHLEPGGYLMIGHSEGLLNMQDDLKYLMPATYRKPGDLKG